MIGYSQPIDDRTRRPIPCTVRTNAPWSIPMSRPLPRVFLFLLLTATTALGQDQKPAEKTLTGKDALGDWTTDAPGVRRKVTVGDLDMPYATPSANNHPRIVPRPEGAWPKVPEGFEVTEFATKLVESPATVLTKL